MLSMADMDRVKRRVAGLEDRVVTRSQIILRDGKPLEIFKQRIEVYFCSCNMTEWQRSLENY